MARADETKTGGQLAVLIAGPTASGKSQLALRLADQLANALIVNCDSMQVYADLAIVTARPTKADRERADHALYGHRDGALPYSVAEWREEVRAVLADHSGRPMIFVGGTGLYFRMLLEGLSPVPSVPDAIRDQVRERMDREGSPALHGDLDQRMANRLSPTDSQRVARALEVLDATGQSLAHWQDLPPDGGLLDAFDVQRVVMYTSRPWIEERIRRRCDQMLGETGLAEVEALRARGLSDDLPVMRAIGVSALGSYLDDVLSREETLEALAIQTRRYAKRQETWFRGQMADWPRFDPAEGDLNDALLRILERG